MFDISKYKGAIFDVDGTMLDSMWKWIEIEAEYVKRQGIKPDEDFVKIMHPLSLYEAAEYFKTEYGVNKTVQQITDEKNVMLEEFFSKEVMLKSGVRELLEALRSKGIKMCVATATDRYLVEMAMERLDISKYFLKTFTCSEEGTTKRSPDIYLRAAEFLGTEVHQTLVFEDAAHAVKTAKQAGFPVVALYDLASDEYQNEIKSFSDYYFVTLDELAI